MPSISTTRSPCIRGFGFVTSLPPNQEFDSSGFDYNVGMAIMTATRTLSQYIVVDTGLAMARPDHLRH